MVSVQLKTHVGADGTLQLQVPTEFRETDLDVLVVMNPIVSSVETMREGLGWPPGFFEETFGSLADDPIERLPQGQFDLREPIG